MSKTVLNMTRPALVTLIAFALLAGGLPAFAGGADSPAPAGTQTTVCPSGCDATTIQQAVDQSGPGDTVRVRSGSYVESVTVPTDKSGLRLLADDQVTLELPSGSQLRLDADDVVVHGFTIDQPDGTDAVRVTGSGLILRDNTILGGLELSGDVHVDARANHWGTDDHSQVLDKLTAPAGSVTVAPILLADGSQDPPAPTVHPSGHCDSMGFTPRFIEEAVWCAHAGGVIVLHPSTQTPPTPHGIIVNPDTPANLIYKNRDITGTIAGGAIPVWAAGWGSEALERLVLCSGGEKSSSQDPPEPTPGGGCESVPDGVIVDAGVGLLEYTTGDGDNKPMTHTLDIRADEVVVSGLTVQHTTNQDDRHGLVVRSDDVTLEKNVIRGNFLPHEHDGGPTLHQMGLILQGSDALVDDNQVRDWRNIGLHIAGSSGEGNQILDNLVQGSRWHGILVEGPNGAAPTLEVRGNEITDHGHSAIRFGSHDTSGYQIRENLLGLTNLNAVTVQSGTQDTAIDVRLNDWGLYRHDLLPARVDDESGTNTVKQVPFLDASGAPDPALPSNTDGTHSTVPATCNAHPDADWDATAGECIYLSIQAAVDFSHAGGTVLVPGSASTPPTPYLENVVIQANSIAETLDDLTLCSTSDGSSCGGDPGSTRIDGSLTGNPALHAEDATGVDVSGLTFQGASPAVRIVSADATSFTGNTVESVPSASSAQQGIVVSDSQAVEVGTNRLLGNAYPGSVSLDLQDSDDALVDTNEILLAGTALRVADSERAQIEGNQVFQPPVSQFGGASLGISLHGGADHTTTENLLFGAGSGLRISGSTGASSQGDHYLVEGTGVGLSDGPGGVQPTGASVNDAHLVSAGTPLHLEAGTLGLDVDATCNDWGVYTASGVQSRIQDDGTGNMVEFVPFRAPERASTAFDCLQLPSVTLEADPDEVIPGEEVLFTVETDSDRPTVLREWNFGDGQTMNQNAPFVNDVTHAYTDAGTYFVTVVVTDSEGGQGIGVTQVDVLNPAPLIQGVDHVHVDAGTPISLNYTVIDPDGGDVDLVAQDLPTGAALVEDAAPDRWRFEWTPGLDQAGTWQVSLVATDDEGATGLLVLELEIRGEAPERLISFVNAGPRPGPSAPGETLELVTKIQNVGANELQVSFSNATHPGGVVFSPDGPTLAPGEEMAVRFHVTLGPVDGSGQVTLRANVLGSPESSKQITYVIEAPVSVSIQMDETTTGSEITGSVRLAYADGSPAGGAFVTGSRLNGPDITGAARSAFSGYANETGEVAFSFPVTDLAAQVPGTHIIEADVWTDRHNYRGHTSYQVSVI